MQTTPTSSPFADIDNVQSALNANSNSNKALEIGHSLNDDFSSATQNNPNLTAGLENTQPNNSKSLKILEKSASSSKSLIKNPTKSLLANDGLDYNVDYSEILKSKKQNNLNFKAIVRYNKEPFKKLIFPNFTAGDFNLFMCLCFIANERSNLKIKVKFSDLVDLSGKREKNKKRLFEQLNEFRNYVSNAQDFFADFG